MNKDTNKADDNDHVDYSELHRPWSLPPLLLGDDF